MQHVLKANYQQARNLGCYNLYAQTIYNYSIKYYPIETIILVILADYYTFFCITCAPSSSIGIDQFSNFTGFDCYQGYLYG